MINKVFKFQQDSSKAKQWKEQHKGISATSANKLYVAQLKCLYANACSIWNKQ